MAAASRIQITSLNIGTIQWRTLAGALITAPGATASIYVHDPNSTLWGGGNATVLATVFSAETGGGTLGQPLTADQNGQLQGWVAAGQDLDSVATFLGVTGAPQIGEPVVSTGLVSDAAATPVVFDTTAIGTGQTVIYDAITGKLKPGAVASTVAWKGTYSGATTYALGDGVGASNGHNYISQQAGNLNHDPTTAGNRPTWWVDSLPASATFTALGSTPPGAGTNNEAFGATALPINSSGSNSAAFGKSALALNTTGGSHAAFGQGALAANSSGIQNSAFGRQAATLVTTGNNVVAVGFQALGSETAGVANAINTVAVGVQALFAQVGAQYNSVSGHGAGYLICQGLANIGSRVTTNAITSGSFNTIYGAASGPTVTRQLQGVSILGACSTAAGNYATALGQNTNANFEGTVAIGTDHTGAGASIGQMDVIALGTSKHTVLVPGTLTNEAHTYERDSIIATGASSGTFTASFTWNGNAYTTAAIAWNATASDVQAALLAATRSGPVAFSADAGADAIYCFGGPLPSTAVTVVFFHRAYGAVTAQSCNNGSLAGGTATFTRTTNGGSVNNNEGFGFLALNNVTVPGVSNTGVGSLALTACTTGTRNTALGAKALQSLSTGVNNTAGGTTALQILTTGTDNTALGTGALANVATGNYNVGIGSNALAALDLGPTGGLSAGDDGEGAINCVAVGAFAGASLTSPRHSITAVGTYALQNDVGGGQSTAIGDKALRSQNGVTRVEPISGLTAYGSYNVALGTGAGYTSATSYSDVDHTRVTGGSFNTNKQTTTGIAQTLIGFYTSQASATQSNGISTLGAFSQAGDGNGSSNGWYATALGYATSAGSAGAVAIGCDHTGVGASTLVQDQIKLGTSLHTIQAGGVFFPVQATTGAAPAYVKGGMYFDTTLNKLRIGGATAWETVTSV